MRTPQAEPPRTWGRHPMTGLVCRPHTVAACWQTGDLQRIWRWKGRWLLRSSHQSPGCGRPCSWACSYEANRRRGAQSANLHSLLEQRCSEEPGDLDRLEPSFRREGRSTGRWPRSLTLPSPSLEMVYFLLKGNISSSSRKREENEITSDSRHGFVMRALAS